MLQSPPGATPAAASAMDKSSPCGSGAPGSSAGSKGQQPRSASAGPAAGESKPKGGKSRPGERERDGALGRVSLGCQAASDGPSGSRWCV
uniref:Uncharacterized protein n=1 Tax=Amazona collaria TaxID=241587 RepID=A0A8B9IYU2_9PSIT